jgi:hypothetical protein
MRNKRIVRAAFVLFCAILFTGCLSISKTETIPIQDGKTMMLSSRVTVYENRGLSTVKWELASGEYRETYRCSLGSVYISDKNNVTCHLKFGRTEVQTGGFILLNNSPTHAKFITITDYRNQRLGVLITSLSGADGDFYKVTDFDRALLK